jgi:hypothetical protein
MISSASQDIDRPGSPTCNPCPQAKYFLVTVTDIVALVKHASLTGTVVRVSSGLPPFRVLHGIMCVIATCDRAKRS